MLFARISQTDFSTCVSRLGKRTSRQSEGFRCLLNFGVVANRFDVVSVGVNDECSVVIRMVMGAKSWRSVVLSACTECIRMKRVHLGPGGGAESYVHQSRRGSLFCQPEPRTVVAIAGDFDSLGVFLGHVLQALDAQWSQGTIVEICGPREIGDPNGDMIDHFLLPGGCESALAHARQLRETSEP